MAEFMSSIRINLRLLLLPSVFLFANLATAQETASDVPIIKIDVALVTTEVTVLGPETAELSAEDFFIYDDGVAQKISHFSRDKLPIAVALLIDRSSSIKPYLPLLQKAAVAALGHLKPQDRVALFAFDDDLLKLSDLTEDRSRIAEIIGKLTVGYGTDIYDAISDVAVYLRNKAPQQRRAVILVSDNCHTVQGRISRETARTTVLESAISVYSVKTPGENYAAGMRERDPACHDSILMVQKLADETGGQVLDVKASASFQEALEKAISHLRLQYTLGFSPSNPGKEGSFHKLTVKLAENNRCPGCRLLARSGYYAGSPPAPVHNEIRMASPESAVEIDQRAIRRKMEAAETIDLDLLDIPFLANAAEQKDPDGNPKIKINLQIDFSGIGFRSIGDRHACTLHIGVFPTDEKRRDLDPHFRTLEGMMREDTYQKVLKAGMLVSFAIPQEAPKENLKIVLFDEGSDTFGSQRTSCP
jgi:Ca-activated chloride channel family protein